MATGLQLGNRINIWAWLSNLMRNDIGVLTSAGVPTSGTSGTGAKKAGPGCLLVDTVSKRLFINTGTKLSPTWTALQSGFFMSTQRSGFGSETSIPHGLGVIPSKVIAIPSDLTPAAVGSYIATYGVHTTTDVLVTVSSGKKYYVLAWP